MIYIAWTSDDINGLARIGICSLWTEVDGNGLVTRELGFDCDGHVVHKVPSGAKRFGLFDNQVVVVTQNNLCIKPEQFNEVWGLSPTE